MPRQPAHSRDDRLPLPGRRQRTFGIRLGIVALVLAVLAFNHKLREPNMNVIAGGKIVPKGQPVPAPYTHSLQIDVVDQARYERERTDLIAVRAVLATLAGAGFLIHLYGIFLADKSLKRREKFQCERCCYELRGRHDATHCPECGGIVRGFPSARSE